MLESLNSFRGGSWNITAPTPPSHFRCGGPPASCGDNIGFRVACEVPPPRVLRGGSWGNLPSNLRASNRLRNEPGLRSDVNGFRIACEVIE